LGDGEFEAFFRELNKRKAVVYLHPADPPMAYDPKLGIMNALVEAPFETTRTVANLLYTGVADRYKNIRYILSHGGGTIPYLAWRISLIDYVQKNKKIPDLTVIYDLLIKHRPEKGLRLLKRMYYDTALVSGDYALKALHAFAGSLHIVFGNDFPFAGYSPIIAKNLERYVGFTKEDLENIYYKNCLELFPQFKVD